MALVTCAGADVIRGRVHMPLRGAWSAKLVLDTQDVPSGSVTLAADGGIELTGYVTGGGLFLDSARVELMGGAGGLGKTIEPASYRNAQLRDPLAEVLRAAGETQAEDIATSILGALLGFWSLNACPAVRALNELCNAASRAAGDTVNWRVKPDGKIWIGAEAWPAENLPEGSDLLEQAPELGRHLIGAETPSLLPGINLEGVGRVLGVDHYIEPSKMRSVAWT